MTQPEPNQPQIQVWLRDQGSILHQLYDLTIKKTKIHQELERTWEVLAREEEITIAFKQTRHQ
jgi:hypothetical protein